MTKAEEITKAIELCELCVDAATNDIDNDYCTPKADRINFYNLVKEVLESELKRKENKPLTLDQLRKREGKPVYVKGRGWHINHGVEYREYRTNAYLPLFSEYKEGDCVFIEEDTVIPFEGNGFYEYELYG